MSVSSLESERLFFYPLGRRHLSDRYVNWLNDPDVNQYLETRGDYTLAKLDGYIRFHEEKEVLFWGIHLKSSGKHIGNIKVDPIDHVERSGEFGLMIGDKQEWGKGYAREASSRIIEYCFFDLNLTAITLGVINNNLPAINLYSRLGFIEVDRKTSVGVYNGEECDAIRMILTREDAN